MGGLKGRHAHGELEAHGGCSERYLCVGVALFAMGGNPDSQFFFSFFTGTGFAAAVARLRLTRLELIGGSGRTAGRYASAARAFISPTAFEQARGGALGAGGGRVGFAGGGLSSESAVGSGRLRACGCSGCC